MTRGCCDEPSCQRRKPMMLMRSDLTGRWYVVTDYQQRGEHEYRAITKHLLPAEAQEQLDRMREGNLAWREGTEPLRRLLVDMSSDETVPMHFRADIDQVLVEVLGVGEEQG